MKILKYVQSKGRCEKIEVEGKFTKENVEGFDKYTRRSVGVPLVVLTGQNEFPKGPEEYYLTKEGAIALHNFGVEQSQLKFNKWLVFFTAILAVATVILAIGVFR